LTLLSERENTTAIERYSELTGWLSGVVDLVACTNVFCAELGRPCYWRCCSGKGSFGV